MALTIIPKMANVGAGAGQIFRDENNQNTLNVKTIKAGSGITVNNNADDIEIVSSLTTENEYLYIPADLFRPIAGSNAQRVWINLGPTTGHECTAIMFPPNTYDQASAFFTLPLDLQADLLTIDTNSWVILSGAPVLVDEKAVFVTMLKGYAHNADPDDALSKYTNNIAGATADRLYRNSFGAIPVQGVYSAGNIVKILVGREGADVEDEYSGNLYFLGIEIVLPTTL